MHDDDVIFVQHEEAPHTAEMATTELQCDIPVSNVPPSLIDPMNLWKALPPVPKYIDITAKHPSDSESYNSAKSESESSLSSGFVSEHDDGIPDVHMDWVEDMFPMTIRALKRAKVGTFVKPKRK
jgi:hypothetical protein